MAPAEQTSLSRGVESRWVLAILLLLSILSLVGVSLIQVRHKGATLAIFLYKKLLNHTLRPSKFNMHGLSKKIFMYNTLR